MNFSKSEESLIFSLLVFTNYGAHSQGIGSEHTYWRGVIRKWKNHLLLTKIFVNQEVVNTEEVNQIGAID